MVIGLPTGQTIVFDLITCPNIMSQGLLGSLIESKDIVKVDISLRNRTFKNEANESNSCLLI